MNLYSVMLIHFCQHRLAGFTPVANKSVLIDIETRSMYKPWLPVRYHIIFK